MENERKRQQQAELEASAKLLKELGVEELQAAKRRELELQQMAADEMLARKLQSDMEEVNVNFYGLYLLFMTHCE